MFLVHTLIINYLYFYYFDSVNILGTISTDSPRVFSNN